MSESVAKRAVRAYRRGGLEQLLTRGFEHSERVGASVPVVRQFARDLTLKKLRTRQANENSPADVIETVGSFEQPPVFTGVWPFYSFRAKQVGKNLLQFYQYISEIQPSVVVEIGSARGGSLYFWTRVLDADTVVSVDIDHRGREEIFRQFDQDTDVATVSGNSHSSETVAEVRNVVTSSPEFIFIDGSHAYEDVWMDFKTYLEIADDRALFGFDDIEAWEGSQRFWNEVHDEYDTDVLVDTGVGLMRVY